MNQSISEKVVDTYKKSKLNVKESSIRDQKIVLTPNKEICMYSQIDIECSDISNTKTTTGLKILTVLEKKG